MTFSYHTLKLKAETGGVGLLHSRPPARGAGDHAEDCYPIRNPIRR